MASRWGDAHTPPAAVPAVLTPRGSGTGSPSSAWGESHCGGVPGWGCRGAGEPPSQTLGSAPISQLCGIYQREAGRGSVDTGRGHPAGHSRKTEQRQQSKPTLPPGPPHPSRTAEGRAEAGLHGEVDQQPPPARPDPAPAYPPPCSQAPCSSGQHPLLPPRLRPFKVVPELASSPRAAPERANPTAGLAMLGPPGQETPRPAPASHSHWTPAPAQS